MFRVIKGSLIKKQRGKRSYREIVENAENAFSIVTLRAWEKEIWKPSDEQIPNLLKGLGCSYNKITKPYEMTANA